MFGVTQKAARKWLVGEGYPDTAKGIQIATQANISFDWFMTGRGRMEIDHSAGSIPASTNVEGPMTVKDDVGDTIGDVLKKLMLAGAVSQNLLADATGVPQPTIYRILAGKSLEPRKSTVHKLAHFFGVTPAELCGDAPLDALHVNGPVIARVALSLRKNGSLEIDYAGDVIRLVSVVDYDRLASLILDPIGMG